MTDYPAAAERAKSELAYWKKRLDELRANIVAVRGHIERAKAILDKAGSPAKRKRKRKPKPKAIS